MKVEGETLSSGISSMVSTLSQNGGLPPEVSNVPDEVLRRYQHTKRVGNYLLGKTLGEGSFAKVKEALHILTGEKVAIKVIDKKKAKEDTYVRKNLRREGKLLQLINHRNIARLYEIMETENSYYLVIELCKGGDLMDLICKRKKLDERETRRFIRQIVSAIHYLHKFGILHRDLKVENLLLDENKDIKIIDFGLSNAVRTENSQSNIPTLNRVDFCETQCGSPAYAAPELLGNKKYGCTVDVWSIGVNMYAMLTGNLPFTVEPFNIKALHAKMAAREMNPMPLSASPDCEDLLKRLMEPDPALRISLEEVMAHPWITEKGKTPLRPAPFPNRMKPADVNNNILNHMCSVMNQSYRISEVIRLVVSGIPNNATATYNLLHSRLQIFEAKQQKQRVPLSRSVVENSSLGASSNSYSPAEIVSPPLSRKHQSMNKLQKRVPAGFASPISRLKNRSRTRLSPTAATQPSRFHRQITVAKTGQTTGHSTGLSTNKPVDLPPQRLPAWTVPAAPKPALTINSLNSNAVGSPRAQHPHVAEMGLARHGTTLPEQPAGASPRPALKQIGRANTQARLVPRRGRLLQFSQEPQRSRTFMAARGTRFTSQAESTPQKQEVMHLPDAAADNGTRITPKQQHLQQPNAPSLPRTTPVVAASTGYKQREQTQLPALT